MSKQSTQFNMPVELSSFTIPPFKEQELKLISKKGGSAWVYSSVWKGQPVAVKKFGSIAAGEEAKEILREARIMLETGSKSSYLMPLKGICIEPKSEYYAIVMELMPKGSLYDLLQADQKLPWTIRYQIACDVSYGLRDLHGQNFIHRDLKSFNILLDDRLRAKLTDFGIAKPIGPDFAQTILKTGGIPNGSLPWMAPELFEKGSSWTKEADIYSLGMVLLELVTYKIPERDMTWKGNTLVSIGDAEIPSDCPPDVKEPIERCWQLPAKRPTAAKVAQYLELLLDYAQEKEPLINLSSTDSKLEKVLPLPLADVWSLPQEDRVIQIQTQTTQALQQGLDFPNFRPLLWEEKEAKETKETKETKEKDASSSWSAFGAVIEACETVLCSPQSTYTQQHQALGGGSTQVHAKQVNLMSLVDYGLNLPRYQDQRCVESATQSFHRLLSPATPLPPWVRHLVYDAWERLNQPVQNSSTGSIRSRLTSEYALYLKKHIDRRQASELKEEKKATGEKPEVKACIPPTLLLALAEFKKQGRDDKSTASCLTQIAAWLNTQLPSPPCDFKPFVMAIEEHSYQLGIELADGFYRHHPFFSQWAECFKVCVSSFTEGAWALDVSAVSHLSRERAMAYVPDGIGTRQALMQVPTQLSPTHWRYRTGPMISISGGERPLDFHGPLPLVDEKTLLRPHAAALNRQWQRHLMALTTDKPDEKTPIVQIRWPEAAGVRYLSPALTQTLFHTQGKQAGQLAHQSRSATPGQSSVWRLTAADACQRLPEYPTDAILGYLKPEPQHPWRQWQHLTLAQRLIDYGHTGTLATLQYGQWVKGQFQPHDPKAKPLLVWLSSPAGLTFCTVAESPDTTATSDIQTLDDKGNQRFEQMIAQLDPRYFTQVFFLTWLLVHEDDQLRNLGFESFITAQGEEKTRIISFDTDTCLEEPWIREDDGGIQIKLKSLLLCLDAMRWPLEQSACDDFLKLEAEAVLERWLTELAPAKESGNRLPYGSVDALLQRWQRLRRVLQLPATSDDPMAPTFPSDHFECLTCLDPPLGRAYTQAAGKSTSPLDRFQAVAKDYVLLSKVQISVSSGLLRGSSLMQPRDVKESKIVDIPRELKMTPSQALRRCQAYRRHHQQVDQFVTYLTQQAQKTDGNPLFEKQMTALVGEVQALNQDTQTQLDRRSRQKSRLERARTYAGQWEPMASDQLQVLIITPDTPKPLLLSDWKKSCEQTTQPSLRCVQSGPTSGWQVDAYNGKQFIMEGQPLTSAPEQSTGWDLSPLVKILTTKPDALAVRAACAALYQNQLMALLPLSKALLDTEAALKRLAKQRQRLLSLQSKGLGESDEPLKETELQFLQPLLEVALRRAVIGCLGWGRLPAGKGLEQGLRLLELGGLVELNLQDCQTVTDAHLIALLQNSPDLIHLNVSGCERLTSKGIQQAALSAPSLLRLSARQLPKLTDLWRGALWLTATTLSFPHLTHADFRGCANLMRIILQAPRLRYLHLGGCGTSTSRFSSAQDWTLTTPMLKEISLKDCTVLTRIKIDAPVLNSIDVQRSSINLLWLKALRTPEHWTSVRRIALSDSQLPSEWTYIGNYPFLIPLTDTWVNADTLSAFHTIVTDLKMASLLRGLPTAGRWRLQLGLMLFLWQQSQKSQKWLALLLSLLKDPEEDVRCEPLTAVEAIAAALSPKWAERALIACLSLLKDPKEYVRRNALIAVGQIATKSPALAEQALAACLLLLKDSYGYVRRDAVSVVGQIATASLTLAERTLDACLLLLKDSDGDVRSAAVSAVGRIITASSILAERALDACLPLLKDSSGYGSVCRSAATAVGQITTKSPGLAERTLDACLPLLKDSDGYVRSATLTAVGQIATASPGLAKRALTACLPLLKDSNWEVRCTTITAVEQIALASPGLAERALDACLPLLKDSYYGTRSAAISALEQIATASPRLAERALAACLPLLKDSYWDGSVRSAAVTAGGQITMASPGLAERALDACLPLLKDSYWDGSVRSAAVTAVGNILSSDAVLIDPMLTVLPALLKHEDAQIRLTAITLFAHMSSSYQVRWGQTLGEYVDSFLQQWFADHPIATQPVTQTAPADASPPPSTGKPAAPSTLTGPSLATLGDDCCLAQRGGERNYWYSVMDFSGLLIALRTQHLNYRLPDDSKTEYPKPGGESACSYRENQNGIFIADPYVQVGECQFSKFLVEDISVITQGTQIDRSKRDPWQAMPRRLFFSLLYHAHWQLIALEIDYTQTQYHILWDNPFGQAGFSESFYKELLPSIHAAVQKLFQTHRKLTTSLSDETKLELKPVRVVKTLDQQGQGMNGYDCGPIAAQNLQDYVVHLSKNKPLTGFDEKQYTIPSAGVSGWESTLKTVREKHYQQARGITTTPSNTKRLTSQQTALTQAQQEQKTQSLSSVKTMVFRELTQKISALPAAQLGLLFAMIDHQRLLLNSDSLNAPYTPKELQTGYTLLQRPPRDDKHTESPKTLSLLFTPTPQPSSSSSVSSSSSSFSSSSSSSSASSSLSGMTLGYSASD